MEDGIEQEEEGEAMVEEGEEQEAMTFTCDEKRENNWNGYNKSDFDCS